MVDPSICDSPALANTGHHLSGTGVELADVVRRFGPEYRSQYGQVMMPSQKRALSDIAACCTEQLGGKLHQCDDCGKPFWCFHSCRNRACPKCHGKQTQQWLERREAELLPCCYFHAVATVPSELRDVFQRHQKCMYGLLMKVAAEAVKELCVKKRHLGALPGILAVLHTWNGQLGVSFRQACMNRFEASGIVGCRRRTLWRTADEYQEDRRPSCPAEGASTAIRAVAANP